MLWIRLFCLGWWLFASATIALAADASPIAECDRLAAEPAADGSGVPFDQIDSETASAACLAAIEADPAAPRLKHEYARALERAGKLEAAKRLYRWAADDGLETARQALTRLASATSSAETSSGATFSPTGEERLAAFIARTGDDPSALSEALRKEIAFEIYRGALRRPAMTLYLRSGNATDQARLLAALIRKVHPDAELRIAHCTLKAGVAHAIVERALTAGLTRSPLLIEQADAAAKSGAADTPELRAVLEAMAATWRDLTTTAEQESVWLADTLRAHGVVLHPIGEGELIARVRGHLWVQIKDGDRWLNLDPAMKRPLDPAGDCDRPVTTPASIDDLEYTLTVELVRDELENGAIVRYSQLKKSFPFSAVPPDGLSLVFAEPWGIDPPENAPDSDYGASFSYTPVLLAGSNQIFGAAFTLPRPDSAPKALRSVSTDVLGGVLAAFGEDAASPRSAPGETMPTVALRLVTTLSGPAMAPERLQQVIFDRRTNGEGSETAPDPQSLVPLPEVMGEYAAMAAITNISASMGAVPADTDLPDKPDDAALRHATFTALGTLNSRYEAIRQAIFTATDGLASPTIITAPSLSILQWSTRAKGGTSLLVLRQSVNVLRTGDGLLPAGGDLTLRAARWAVASVLAERFLVDSATGDRWFEPNLPSPVHHDLIELFGTGRDAKALFASAGENNSIIDRLEISVRARNLMRDRLDAGHSLLLPARTALSLGKKYGWWVVDGTHGTLFDELEDGTHGDLEEEPFIIDKIPRFARRRYCALHLVVAGVALAAAVSMPTPQSVKQVSDIAGSLADAEKNRRKIQQAGKAVCSR